MEWYEDSKLNLEEANEIISEIEKMEIDSIHDERLLKKCKPKIKNCLENCRSPLDYTAQYIYEEYCKGNYTENRSSKAKIYYPIKDNKSAFLKEINKNFRGLVEYYPGLTNYIETTQYYHDGNDWLKNLVTLVNENKHKRLSYSQTDKTIEIGEFQMGGISIKNSTFVNVGVPIRIGNKDYDLINDFPPGSTYNNITSKNKIIFKELSLPVVETLREIQKGVSEICNIIYAMTE